MSNFIDWSPAIGDPTLIGWFTFCAYLVTASLCFTAYMRCRQQSNISGHNLNLPIARLIWLGLFLAFLFLGINKQLDLQTLLTATGRNLAFHHGWYAERRKFQAVFIVSLSLLSILAILIIARIFRLVNNVERLALIGVVVELCFLLIRASSFHHLIHRHLVNTHINVILELSGIGIVLWAALLRRTDTPYCWKETGSSCS